MKKTIRNYAFLFFGCAAASLISIPNYQKAIAQSEFEIQPTAAAFATDNETPRPRIVATANIKSTVAKSEDSNKTNENASDLNPVETANFAAVKKSAAAASPYTATAYCLNGRTASGSGVRRGIIAADPRVLPLGTRVQLTAGTWSGTYTVTDTGGKIKGKKIDVWVPSLSEAIRFGRRTVHITVLGKK